MRKEECGQQAQHGPTAGPSSGAPCGEHSHVLNAIRSRPIADRDVRAALDGARGGPVAEGSVGAGTGTVAFGWKGGIGTSSRRAAAADSSWTIGVLVQANFGGDLLLLGVPVGRALGRDVQARGRHPGRQTLDHDRRGDGRAAVHRNLRRLAARALVGLSRTGL